MNGPNCLPVESLARVRELPAGSVERRHVDECPRCRAALLAFLEFERDPGTLPAEAGAAGANARLETVIDSLTAPGKAATPAGRQGAGWLRALFAPPAMRFAAGFAVLAIVAASAWMLARGPAERLQRGAPEGAGAASVRAVDSGWELTWPAVEGADSYDVVFLSPELREVARVAGVSGTRLVLPRASLPAGISPGARLLVEVDARGGGAILHLSVPAPIELR